MAHDLAFNYLNLKKNYHDRDHMCVLLFAAREREQ